MSNPKRWCCASAALNMPVNLQNSAVATGLESIFTPFPKQGNAKDYSNYHIIAFISHASKVMLKILQASLQQSVNWELPDVQAGFRKGRGTRDQIANIHWTIEKGREFQRKVCFIDYTKAFDCGSQETGKFWKRQEYQTTWPAFWETCRQVMNQQLELDNRLEQQTDSK